MESNKWRRNYRVDNIPVHVLKDNSKEDTSHEKSTKTLKGVLIIREAVRTSCLIDAFEACCSVKTSGHTENEKNKVYPFFKTHFPRSYPVRSSRCLST